MLALLMISALLAEPLRSYVQPLIMRRIPFGAHRGGPGAHPPGSHVSMMSMFRLVALTGVVNSSLIMVTSSTERGPLTPASGGWRSRLAGGRRIGGARDDGLALAVREARVHRFRPILLTSLTTLLFGLAPLT